MRNIKIYPPCNFEVNPITHFGVISLFHQIFKILILFVLYFKIYKTDGKFKLQKCAACQDLPTLQFWSKSHYPFWNYFPFCHPIFKIVILFILYLKNYERQMVSWNCKNAHHVEIYLPCNFEVNLITHLGVLALFSSNL